MAQMLLTIQHDNILFSPPVKDGVQIEWERTSTPGKLTFSTIMDEDNKFTEGDIVCFYYDNKPVFKGYVFTKKHDRDNILDVTCYDQLRYLKNKFSYVFEKKTATEILKSLAKDFQLTTGSLDNTKYIIPTLLKEDSSLFDIILSALDDTLLNTGNMFVLYDDFGKLTLKNTANMMSEILITDTTAGNFDYSSSIDEETYNKIVLYYDPNTTQGTSGTATRGGGTTTSQAQMIVNKAKGEIGNGDNPKGSNKNKYTDAYGYRGAWCAIFVWWVFRECGLSNLFYGGNKTAYTPTLMNYYKSQGRFITDKSKFQPGDLVFFHYSDRNGKSAPTHVEIVESINSNGSINCIGGNVGDQVKKGSRYNSILGAARPAYSGSSVKMRSASSNDGGGSSGSGGSTSTPTTTTPSTSDYKVFYAKDDKNISKWGLLQLFEKVDSPSIGDAKAKALLQLHNRKTRSLSVKDAFGDTSVRAGCLIPVKLKMDDVNISNYMLVESVTHTFTTDQYTMNLELEGAWAD